MIEISLNLPQLVKSAAKIFESPPPDPNIPIINDYTARLERLAMEAGINLDLQPLVRNSRADSHHPSLESEKVMPGAKRVFLGESENIQASPDKLRKIIDAIQAMKRISIFQEPARQNYLDKCLEFVAKLYLKLQQADVAVIGGTKITNAEKVIYADGKGPQDHDLIVIPI